MKTKLFAFSICICLNCLAQIFPPTNLVPHPPSTLSQVMARTPPPIPPQTTNQPTLVRALAVVPSTNLSPVVTSLVISWPLSTSLLRTTDLTNWTSTNVTATVSVTVPNDPAASYFRVPLLNQTVSLQWSTNAAETITGYNVFWGSTAGGNYTNSIDVGLSYSYQITNLAPGKLYFFEVTAYNQNGTQSDRSLELHYVVPRTQSGLSIRPILK